MTNELGLECQVCGFVGLEDGNDGFFYCQRCGSQADGIRDTAVDNEEMILTKENLGSIVQRRVPVVKTEPFSQSQPPSQFWETLRTQEEDEAGNDGLGPTEPADFGREPSTTTLSYEDYYSEIRMRYVMGVQIMIELQIKALVEKFNVSPIIVDMVQPIWLRFVASTQIFSDDWADEVVNESESQVQGETQVVGARAKHRAEPHNILGKRSVMIWYQSVSKTIPLSSSLVVSFLVCHLAREPILATDIVKWTLDGKLPYFAAFVEIEKQIGPPTNACPLSSSRMFRPIQAISIQKLESLAACIAHSIHLELPPVNFYGIASRYLRHLSLPVETILPHACRIYEWSMPPELWLSANDFRLPTRACVLAILIVSIRILYKIHGFGKWEMALSSANKRAGKKRDGKKLNISDTEFKCNVDVNSAASILINSKLQDDDSDDSDTKPYDNKLPNLDATKILLSLESKYNELIDTSDHCKDLQTYLEYCKDVVFAGVELSFEDHEEQQIIEDLWNFFQKEEDHKPSSPSFSTPTCGPHKRPRDSSKSKTKKTKDGDAQVSATDSHKERAIKQMISNMEENKFCYIPPRTKVKRSDYLHYTRKKDDGAYTYAAHADYYILLRSCARVAQLDVRSMHFAVLSFERRLGWLENNIEHCLKVMPTNEDCQLCQDDEMVPIVPNDDSVGFSKLNL
ncbi:hypothetical protein OSB04_007138 [Centaurea solstitialis]|uniref:Rrn7/TAF1B N-terminal cyclin domain-containing protein n=1 Tax=Centaurea solstitialis TaxID=347529 RepID=A0AA38TRZ1_9ASTR|nr:hypothetical protein OSB04_007138 [Centaurea solstitialis]